MKKRHFVILIILIVQLAPLKGEGRSYPSRSLDLLIETDGKGNFSIIDQKVTNISYPITQRLRLQAGYTYLELKDERGRFLFNKTVYLSSLIFYDTITSPSSERALPALTGGTFSVEKIQHHLRIPYYEDTKCHLNFYSIHKIPTIKSAPITSKKNWSSAGEPIKLPFDLLLKEQASIPLEFGP